MFINTITLNAAEHPLKGVTVFQSSTAELTRTFRVDLRSGRNILEIRGIPDKVDEGSPRIHGLGPDARVFDISCDKRLSKSPMGNATKNTEEIKKLRAKRKAAWLEKDVRQEEYNMLNDAARALVSSNPTQLNELVDSYVERKRNAMKAVHECEEQIEVLEHEIWKLTNLHRGKTAACIVATLIAKRDHQVELQLTYLITGAKWQPYYDLRATTSEGKTSPEVSLLYCANITQATGEDWNDAVLTLSTASSHALRSLAVPKVDPLKISVPDKPVPEVMYQQPQQRGGLFGGAAHAPPPQPVVIASAMPKVRLRRKSTARRTTMSMDTREESETEDWDAVEDEAETSLGSEQATVDRSPLSLAYRVDGAVSLPSDGIAHKVSIAILDFTADLKYVCVPRKNTSAFIEGSVKNTSEYELLPGPVSVFMDDGFVTKTSFDRLIGVNESFNCVLGVDTALKVSYEKKSRTTTEPQRNFAEPTKTTTRMVTTTVTNGHHFDVSGLVVRDAIPLGDEDSNIKVMLRHPDGLARAKDGETVPVDVGGDGADVGVRWTKVENGVGGEKDGMYEWVCAIPAGKKVKLEAEWDVKAPSSVKWEEGASARSEGK